MGTAGVRVRELSTEHRSAWRCRCGVRMRPHHASTRRGAATASHQRGRRVRMTLVLVVGVAVMEEAAHVEGVRGERGTGEPRRRWGGRRGRRCEGSVATAGHHHLLIVVKEALGIIPSSPKGLRPLPPRHPRREG